MFRRRDLPSAGDSGKEPATRKPDVVLLLHFCYVAACLLGLVWQMSHILSVYMQYHTGSAVELRTIRSLNPPDLSVCIRYVEILKKGGLTKEQDQLPDKRAVIRAIQANVTIKRIFQDTPPAEDILSGCLYKKPNSYVNYVYQEPGPCFEMFSVSRFYTQEYLCYRFHMKVNESVDGVTGKYHYDTISESLYYPGLLYGFLLNNHTLGRANSIKPVVHDRKHLPFEDLAYAPYFSRQVNNSVVYNEISVFYRKTVIVKLPPPHETACDEYLLFNRSQKRCIDTCLKGVTVTRFDKVPFSAIEADQTLDLKHISGLDIQSESFGRELDHLENECEGVCWRKQCVQKVHSTTVLKEGTGEFKFFVIRLYVPMEPLLLLTFIPASSLEELLVYISTSLSVWLGFSFLAVDPVHLWRQVVRKQRVSRGIQCHCDHCTRQIASMEQEVQHLRRRQKRRLIGYDYDGSMSCGSRVRRRRRLAPLHR